MIELVDFSLAQMAQVSDGFGSSFGGDQISALVSRLPNLGKAQQLSRQRVLSQHLPVVMEMFGFLQVVEAQLFQGLFHRIKGIRSTGENTHLKQFMEFLRQGVFAGAH